MGIEATGIYTAAQTITTLHPQFFRFRLSLHPLFHPRHLFCFLSTPMIRINIVSYRHLCCSMYSYLKSKKGMSIHLSFNTRSDDLLLIKRLHKVVESAQDDPLKLS